MSTVWIVLLSIGAIFAACVLAELVLKRNAPRKTLGQQFGGDDGRDATDQNLSDEMQEAMERQMRATAQGGVQGMMHGVGGRWQVLPARITRDRDAYNKMFVPKRAKK
jgi:hypothetical protein